MIVAVVQRGHVLVVSGPPAAGKTTTASLLAARRSPSVHLHADDFWGFVMNGYVDPWLAAAYEQNVVVIDAACTSAGIFARGRYHVVLDACLGPWFVPDLLALIGPDIPVDYVLLMPSLDAIIRQLAARTDHGFTSEDATRHMYGEFASTLTGVEGHVIDPAGASPEDTADLIEQAAEQGRLRIAGR
ncbi:MAG TPA: AAA family ATPase [Mycobacteriales bacterium]